MVMIFDREKRLGDYIRHLTAAIHLYTFHDAMENGCQFQNTYPTSPLYVSRDSREKFCRSVVTAEIGLWKLNFAFFFHTINLIGKRLIYVFVCRRYICIFAEQSKHCNLMDREKLVKIEEDGIVI